jgi:flagellar biogenesis protein FliO
MRLIAQAGCAAVAALAACAGVMYADIPRLLPPGAGDEAQPLVAAEDQPPAEPHGSVQQVAAETPRHLSAATSPLAVPLKPQAGQATQRLGRAALPPGVPNAASLGLVVGLFVLVIWAVRRGAPGATMPLPAEAVEVLGRATLAGRQQVHLVRCGHKLLLVCLTPTGAETLTEIWDPAEVEHLQNACRQADGGGNPLRKMLGTLAGAGKRTQYRGFEEVDFGHLENRAQESRV